MSSRIMVAKLVDIARCRMRRACLRKLASRLARQPRRPLIIGRLVQADLLDPNLYMGSMGMGWQSLHAINCKVAETEAWIHWCVTASLLPIVFDALRRPDLPSL